jgi:hypothetical protein
MTEFFLEYKLQEGYIHNWLVAGPLTTSVSDLDRFDADDLRAQVAQHYYRRASEIHSPPIERETFQVGDSVLTWRYQKCLEDHRLDFSGFYDACHYLRSWAYAQLVVPTLQEATLSLITEGPADLWLNRAHIHHHGDSLDAQPTAVPVVLSEGANELLIRIDQVAVRACVYDLALRLHDLPAEDVTVQLPVDHPNVPRRQKAERIYAEAHLERGVILSNEGPVLHWDDTCEEGGHIDVSVQDLQKRNKVYAALDTRPSERVELGHRQLLLEEGPHQVALQPQAIAIERYRIVYQEYLPFHVLETPFSDALYGTYEQRRREALGHATRRAGDLYSEIAKLAMGLWTQVDADQIAETIARIKQRRAGSEPELLGLLGVLYRHPDTRALTADTWAALQECIRSYRYWHDEPGYDALDFADEEASITFHACEVLAGERFPDQVFTLSGKSGRWHRERGERLALDWMLRRGRFGFCAWNSCKAFAGIVVALSHLADLAEDTTVRELAAVTMDKLLFALAANSYKGVFGSTHGQSEAAMLKSGRLDATSGICRLLWGMGVWNQHVRGVVALACSEYEVPPFMPAIAADLGQEVWAREQHAPAEGQSVNLATYRTADYMLSSAQDYRAGEPGSREHVWQATLGPDAVVFANHPASASEADVRQANYWRGNKVLPRVAQWKDVLVAVHNAPLEEWPGFTHAYWPTYDFDEQVLRDGWAFARTGTGYLALTAAQGLTLMHRGPGAFHELRSDGPANTWLCMMGREATDGSFGEFQEAVLGLEIVLTQTGVDCQTLRGDGLAFAWEGPLWVNGVPEPLAGFKHYESAYCEAELGASQMDIQYNDYTMRLDFG